MAEETFDFADFSLQGESASSARPTGDYPSIDEVINKPIWCTGFSHGVETENGKRTLVKFKWELEGAETHFGQAVKNCWPCCKIPAYVSHSIP